MIKCDCVCLYNDNNHQIFFIPFCRINLRLKFQRKVFIFHTMLHQIAPNDSYFISILLNVDGDILLFFNGFSPKPKGK